MNKRNENRNRMILAVLAVVNKFRNLWEAIPVFVTIVNELNTKQEEIEKLRKVADSDITGKTRDKNSMEERLLESVYTLSAAICVMAKRTGNNELLEKVDYTQSELTMAREAELVGIGQNVVSLARENLALLADSGINEAGIAELEELAAGMKGMIAVPRVSLSERKSANQKLKEEIDNAAEIMDEQLDRLMIRFKNPEPGFFSEYMNARHIVAYGIRHEGEEGEEGDKGEAA